MIILIKLLLAHFIGDFLLQPKSWVQKKEKRKAAAIQLYFQKTHKPQRFIIDQFLHLAALYLLWYFWFQPKIGLAKSVFRFSDLKEAKDRKLTEYILTGTLLSFGIAMFTGVLVV